MPENIQDWVPENHICKFRTDNWAALSECFVKVLAMAGETGMLKKVGGVSVDGTKIKAGTSKHVAVSHERAGQMIEQFAISRSGRTRPRLPKTLP
ncbi:MAG: hypothetical protein R6V56_03565 [Lentisphaeria bacterium]